MSAAEVRSRTAGAVRHRADDAAWRTMRRLWSRTWEPETRTLRESQAIDAPLGFLTPRRAQEVAGACPAAVASVAEAATAAIAGRRTFFGHGELFLAQPIDFSLDPITGKRWPERHAKLLDYRHSDVGDPKIVWELNRFQHLPGLIQSWLLTEDTGFVRAALDEILRWQAVQVPGRGIAWSNGFEAGLRAISFALCLDGLRGSELVTAHEQEALVLSLSQHGLWITRDPSEHSSANNHLVGELAGLATIGLLVPELRSAERWATHALRGLEREAARQILDDGLGAEQAFTYTLFVVDLLLLVVSLLQAQDRGVPQPITEALNRVGGALWAQLGTRDPAPTYGDTDDAWAVRLDTAALRDARGVAASIFACTGSSEAGRAARGLLDPAALWLFGESAIPHDAGRDRVLPTSAHLEHGGLVILRDGEQRAMMDVGPLGYLSIAAHGHADALQVTLTEGGEELVVDPGVGSYFGQPAVRRSFRGTGFHPTVTVDGIDQSEQAGPFLWRRHAKAWLRYVDLARGMAVGEHDGYANLTSPVRHRRALIVLECGPVLVYDRLDASSEHDYRLVWPLHPDLDAKLDHDELVTATRDGSPRLVMRFAASTGGTDPTVRLSRGEEIPFSGWWSGRLDEWVPAWHCALETKAHGPVEFATLLCPVTGDASPETTVCLQSSAFSASLDVQVGQNRWLISVAIDEDEPIVILAPTEDRRTPGLVLPNEQGARGSMNPDKASPS